MPKNTDGFHRHCVKQQSQAHKYIPYSSIYTKFKNRQNEPMVRTVVTSEEHPRPRAQNVQRSGGVTGMGVEGKGSSCGRRTAGAMEEECREKRSGRLFGSFCKRLCDHHLCYLPYSAVSSLLATLGLYFLALCGGDMFSCFVLANELWFISYFNII